MSDVFFNKIYQQAEGMFFGNIPTKELCDYLNAHPLSGEVLEIGCGDGRDTFFLLQKGFNVTAIDYSAVGIEKLCTLYSSSQENKKGNLNALVADVRSWEWPPKQFDLVVAVTLLDHLCTSEILKVVDGMVRSARSNALFFIEVHTVDDPGMRREGPVSELASEIQHYFDWNELLNLCRPFMRILRYVERVEWDHDHGIPHMHGFATLIGRLNAH